VTSGVGLIAHGRLAVNKELPSLSVEMMAKGPKLEQTRKALFI